MPGSVLRVGAAVGDTVTAGQPLIWLEAMKMEHTVPRPATVCSPNSTSRPASRSRSAPYSPVWTTNQGDPQ